MSPRPKALIIAFIAMLLLGFVSACGYKDDLYLPDEEQAEKTDRNKKPAAPEATAAEPRE